MVDLNFIHEKVEAFFLRERNVHWISLPLQVSTFFEYCPVYDLEKLSTGDRNVTKFVCWLFLAYMTRNPWQWHRHSAPKDVISAEHLARLYIHRADLIDWPNNSIRWELSASDSPQSRRGRYDDELLLANKDSGEAEESTISDLLPFCDVKPPERAMWADSTQLNGPKVEGQEELGEIRLTKVDHARLASAFTLLATKLAHNLRTAQGTSKPTRKMVAQKSELLQQVVKNLAQYRWRRRIWQRHRHATRLLQGFRVSVNFTASPGPSSRPEKTFSKLRKLSSLERPSCFDKRMTRLAR
jgi:hypothetical protein